MRLAPDKIKYLSKKIAEVMSEDEEIQLLLKKDVVSKKIEKIIIADLEMEDSIEQEVREMLKEHSQTIRKEGLDYESLFKKAKERMIRKRGLVF